jgi:hypothetical protein
MVSKCAEITLCKLTSAKLRIHFVLSHNENGGVALAFRFVSPGQRRLSSETGQARHLPCDKTKRLRKGAKATMQSRGHLTENVSLLL